MFLRQEKFRNAAQASGVQQLRSGLWRSESEGFVTQLAPAHPVLRLLDTHLTLKRPEEEHDCPAGGEDYV